MICWGTKHLKLVQHVISKKSFSSGALPALLSPETLKAYCNKLEKAGDRVCLMGWDVGKTKVGVAVSDDSRVVGTPLTKVTRQKHDRATVPGEQVASTLRALADKHQARGIVVGWPLDQSGRMDDSCLVVMQFLESLQATKHFQGLPMALWDERGSTFLARKSLERARVPRGRHEGLHDQVAAALILQSFLDA